VLQFLFFIFVVLFSPHASAETELTKLLEVLRKPQEVDVPEAYRKQYAESAKALSELLKKNPEMLTDPVKLQIQSLLISRNPGHKAAQNDLNRYLNPELIAEFDKNVTQARLHSSNLNPCEVMCRTARRLSEQVGESLIMKEDAYLENSDSRESFSMAVRSLMGEFLIKAHQLGCKIDQIEQRANQLLTDIHQAQKDKKPSEGDARDEALREALTGWADQSAAQKAIDFFKRSAGSSNWDSQGLPTQSAALFYLIHTYRFSRALDKGGFEQDKKQLGILHRQIETRLKKVVDSREELLGEQGASLVTIYSLASLGLTLPEGNEIQALVAEVLAKKRKEMALKHIKVFPYNLSKPTESPSERAGAARTVVAQLAIYLGGAKEEKLQNAGHLLESLEIYNRHFRDIFSGIGLNQTHDFEDADLLAPYYGPSTIPFVFDAIAALEKDKGLTLKQKEKIGTLRLELQRKLLGMFEPEGLFQSQHKIYYSAAQYYDNALAGLALENACRFQNEKAVPRERGVPHSSALKSVRPLNHSF